MIDQHEALGVLEQIRLALDELARAFTAADEFGIVERIEPAAIAAGAVVQFDYRGTFKSVVVVNTGANPIRVAFNQSDARADATATVLLSVRGFAVIPYRGSMVYVGSTAGSSAAVLFARTAQPFNAGTM